MRGVKRFLVVLFTAVLPLLAQAQWSQRLRDRDPDLEASKKLAAELQQANFHWGSFYLLSRFRITDAGYSEASGLPAGSQAGGLSLSVDAPQRLYYVPHKKTIFTLELTPGYSFFNATDDDRRTQFNYLVRADAHFLFNHLYLDVYGLREDQLRSHVADINRFVTVRSDETGVAGEWKYSSKTSALFNLRLRETTFPRDRFQPENIPVDLLDREEKNGRLSLMHKTFPLTSLFVSAERSDYEFKSPVSFKDARRTWVGAGAAYNSGRAMLRLEAGPLKLEFQDPQARDYTGVTASLQGVRTTSRQTYSLAADRDLGFSLYAGNHYFIATTLRAGVSHSATRRLTLRLNSTLEQDDYDVPVNGRERQDQISFHSVGFIYAFRRLNIGADVGWYERTSTIDAEEDAGIRTVLLLSFTP